MGAIVAAMIANGMVAEEMQKEFSSRSWYSLFDPDMKTGIVAGDKIYEWLTKLFDGQQIEDRDIPVSIVATDINAGEKVVFRTGSVVDALRASLSVP